MDAISIINSVAPIIVTVASAYIVKGVSKSHKYVLIAADAVNTLKDLQTSLEDGALTREELEKLEADVVQIEKDLKS